MELITPSCKIVCFWFVVSLYTLYTMICWWHTGIANCTYKSYLSSVETSDSVFTSLEGVWMLIWHNASVHPWDMQLIVTLEFENRTRPDLCSFALRWFESSIAFEKELHTTKQDGGSHATDGSNNISDEKSSSIPGLSFPFNIISFYQLGLISVETNKN